ncbi:general secretion pathway protein GspD [Salegentibacter salinarum]|uniref:General secretion pathway protein GspD n=1 Tax=Salegentibacter salinarum TaxID=447422 RepID=A0A2N0TVJ0_9FLAO|nr:general secretion pathway protein GspD [Salegentibacter salinarum]
MRHFVLFLIILFLGFKGFGQEQTRLSSLQNRLEVLAIEYPELDEKVNVNISNTTLSNFLLAISEVHQININVDPDLNSVEIINNFNDVSIQNLLFFLAKEYNLKLDITGNIISISRYVLPVAEPEEKQLVVKYNPIGNTISLNLNDNPLSKVFRKITDESGKNLVYAPGMDELELSIYLSEVNIDTALEKLALANNLKMAKSKDGFYLFNTPISGGESNGVERAINKNDNFYYRVVDSLNRIIEVDFNNVPAEDVIYTIAEDLNLNYFTASSLNNMGEVSVTSESINFDKLLEKIFESLKSQDFEKIINDQNRNRPQTQAQNISERAGAVFTYKKENNIYYFGTENQLALKQTEVVQLMHRSIEMLSNPSSNRRQNRSNRNNFMTGSSNYISGNNSTFGNNGMNNNNQSDFNRNIDRRTTGEEELNTEAIKKLIPEDILNGININIDSELNSFIVSGPSTNIERFKKFITYIDKPVPVVLIEVMIMEVNKSATIETGVSFGIGEERVSTEGQAFPTTSMRLGAETINRVIGGFDGFGSLNMGKVLPNFYMDLKAMESNGSIKILSTPKLSTLNGHKAYLSSGETTYYAVTNQNFFGSQIPQTSETTNYYPIDAELALDIMPFVSGDGEITLDINVIQSSFNGQRIAENAPPGMNSREFSSIIRMRDQDVAILGGIEERTKDDSGSGVPLLARIPVIKWLFSERRREDSKRKLNILIKPTVIY